LEAGAFGVAQSRKRAFIWAAAPGETLPDWPEPMHVFASPELKINLPDGKYYVAANSTARGAPFRSMTVRDTIGDLPPVENGAREPTLQVYISSSHLYFLLLVFLICIRLSAELTIFYAPVWKRTRLVVPEEDSRQHAFAE
jgi:hypothetical protein